MRSSQLGFIAAVSPLGIASPAIVEWFQNEKISADRTSHSGIAPCGFGSSSFFLKIFIKKR
jgi:hypothetical protein